MVRDFLAQGNPSGAVTMRRPALTSNGQMIPANQGGVNRVVLQQTDGSARVMVAEHRFGNRRPAHEPAQTLQVPPYRHYEAQIILLCVRWYLRYSLSYRDLEEMMAERGLCVDHTTIYRWVQHF